MQAGIIAIDLAFSDGSQRSLAPPSDGKPALPSWGYTGPGFSDSPISSSNPANFTIRTKIPVVIDPYFITTCTLAANETIVDLRMWGSRCGSTTHLGWLLRGNGYPAACMYRGKPVGESHGLMD